MLGGFLMISALVFFVMAHEAGHFFAAKATGMKATQFFFGFGPKIFSFVRGGTEYGMKAIPAGGYVRIAGMNPYEPVDPDDVGSTYREKKFWEKAFVVLAGVGVNITLAFILLFALFVAYGNVTDQVVPEVSSISQEVNGDPSPALTAGLQVGDRIVSVAGVATGTWDEVVAAISSRPGESTTVGIVRNGTDLEL
ncbi:MAG: site-2 protease family protein, partial [Acidimicrobiia bacterium]|nr:site-2 protease family protein [Acidimicrobiia bacterium]